MVHYYSITRFTYVSSSIFLDQLVVAYVAVSLDVGGILAVPTLPPATSLANCSPLTGILVEMEVPERLVRIRLVAVSLKDLLKLNHLIN